MKAWSSLTGVICAFLVKTSTLGILIICLRNYVNFQATSHFVTTSFQFRSVQLLSCVQLFATPWTTAHQASLSFTNSWSLLKLMSIESVMPSNHLTLCRPLSSCIQSFPALGSFPVNQFFASGGQSIGASASISVLPMNIQSSFPLGLISLILQSIKIECCI